MIGNFEGALSSRPKRANTIIAGLGEKAIKKIQNIVGTSFFCAGGVSIASVSGEKENAG
jgi:hypothetical protein